MLRDHDTLVDPYAAADEAALADRRFTGDGRVRRDRHVFTHHASMTEVYVIINLRSAPHGCMSDSAPVYRRAAADVDVIADFDAAEIRQFQPPFATAYVGKRVATDGTVRSNPNAVSERRGAEYRNVGTDITETADARPVLNYAARGNARMGANRDGAAD